MTTEPKKTVYRESSKDGQFTTRREAERHPDTTEKERVRIHPPARAPPRKK